MRKHCGPDFERWMVAPGLDVWFLDEGAVVQLGQVEGFRIITVLRGNVLCGEIKLFAGHERMLDAEAITSLKSLATSILVDYTFRSTEPGAGGRTQQGSDQAVAPSGF